MATKPVEWIMSSHKDLKKFPDDARNIEPATKSGWFGKEDNQTTVNQCLALDQGQWKFEYINHMSIE